MVGPPRGAPNIMTQQEKRQPLPRAQVITNQALSSFYRFIHIQASSGIVLLLTAIAAMVWANSSFSSSYHDLWHSTLGFNIAGFEVSQSLHFWINDGLMTFFFLVVGMEVRYEIHNGSLSTIRDAVLPISAAIGGVALPALIYLSFNLEASRQAGWAIPTATDIAFAVGLLALLGSGISHNIRVFLLALAIIDDIVAVLIIALFYSSGLELSGFYLIAAGILMVLALHRMGINSAWGYVIPGFIVWFGVLKTGAHPTLAGVILGLLTPVTRARSYLTPLEKIQRYNQELVEKRLKEDTPHDLMGPIEKLRRAQRDIVPPAIRMQAVLHPWVAFLVMPIFALANAGISLDGIDLTQGGSLWVTAGVAIALVVGKPAGIIGASWLAVKLGMTRLPAGVTWGGITLVSLFAGIGFTMSIFISMLAFSDINLLNAAKLGVLCGSVVAGILGMLCGVVWIRRNKAKEAAQASA